MLCYCVHAVCPIPMCSRGCVIVTDERGCEICTNCSIPQSSKLLSSEAAELHYDAPHLEENKHIDFTGSVDVAINTDNFVCAIPMCSTNCVIAIDSRGCEICSCTTPPSTD